MKKKILCLVLAVLLILPSLIVSAANVTMYAQDGRTKSVDSSKVSAYKKVGWYEGVTMFAKDGRSKIVSPFKVAAEKKVGWYEGVKMYSSTGTEKVVSPFKVKEEKLNGWNIEVTMFAQDGRSIVIPPAQVAAYKKVGWYEAVPMCSIDGRLKMVSPFKVAAEKKVGWYTLADYGKTLVSKKNGETALTALENQFTAVPSSLWLTAYKETLNAYYKKIGCPIAVISWEKGTNIIGTPEIYITYRNVSPKTIASFKDLFTCYDAFGKVTTDYPTIYTGTIESTLSSASIESGEVFSTTNTLYSNKKTNSISWPKVIEVKFTDGTSWKK